MNKKVFVKVVGTNAFADGDGGDNKTETFSEGEYYEKDGCRYIFYDEIVTDAGDAVRNQIKIENNRISIRKRGIISSELIFEINRNNVSEYSTPFGTFLMGVFANDIKYKETDDRLDIDINYAMEVEYSKVSDCKVHIEVTDYCLRD